MDGDVRVVISFHRRTKTLSVILNMFILFTLPSILALCVVNLFGIKETWIAMRMTFMLLLSTNVIFVSEHSNLERSCKLIA